jgi:CDP-glucose 4,6-dehydratase
VLEPLAGYIALAERLLQRDAAVGGGWNFGPDPDDCVPVRDVVEALRVLVPGSSWRAPAGHHPHEAAFLSLDSAKARRELGWRPRWRLDEALRRTVEWHREWRRGGDMQALTGMQIEAYADAGSAAGSAA